MRVNFSRFSSAGSGGVGVAVAVGVAVGVGVGVGGAHSFEAEFASLVILRNLACRMDFWLFLFASLILAVSSFICFVKETNSGPVPVPARTVPVLNFLQTIPFYPPFWWYL